MLTLCFLTIIAYSIYVARKVVKPHAGAGKSVFKTKVGLIMAAAFIIALLYHGSIVYQVIRLRSVVPSQTSLMLQRRSEAARNGAIIKPQHMIVTGEKISSDVKKAVIASEDLTFYSHHGFDWRQIKQVMEENWDAKQFKRGASTITQQLAKNIFLSESKNLLRKFDEAFITMEMELILRKGRILELYLNSIEWGDGIYGVEAAAAHYFNTSAAQLSKEQASFLAAVIPDPRSAYNPKIYPDRVQARARWVRIAMEQVDLPD